MGRKQQRRERGIFKHNDPGVKLADFSYQNDELADLIVRCWTNHPFRDTLLTGANRKNNARQALQGLAHWEQDDADQVIFVLPNESRQAAKLLMACVPNGI
jgi:hypothetical protein